MHTAPKRFQLKHIGEGANDCIIVSVHLLCFSALRGIPATVTGIRAVEQPRKSNGGFSHITLNKQMRMCFFFIQL